MSNTTQKSLAEYFVEWLNEQTRKMVTEGADEAELFYQIKDAHGVPHNLRQLPKEVIRGLFQNSDSLDLNMRVFKRDVGLQAENGKRTCKGQLWDVTFLFKP